MASLSGTLCTGFLPSSESYLVFTFIYLAGSVFVSKFAPPFKKRGQVIVVYDFYAV